MNRALLAKYDVPGPRYTSYPTVPYWEGAMSEAVWVERLRSALDRSAAEGRGAALYIHIPFCRSLCTYCGCNTRISRYPGVADPYVSALLHEWKLYGERLGSADPMPVAEIHLGGGTPTFLSPEGLRSLLEPLLRNVRLVPAAELSIEADPRVTLPAHLDVLASLGFRRISLGVQDFDRKVQETVNRVQSREMVLAVTQTARARGFTSVNYDLIYGLPHQTPESVEQTARTVAEHRPDRVAFYAYAHVPWIKAAHRRFTEADLPSGAEKRILYETGRRVLEEAGYREIGMDHFALETDSLWKASRSGALHRNFMGYTPEFIAPLFGLGVSAIGDAGDAFAQNEKKLEDYYRRLERNELPLSRGHSLTPEDRSLRDHILALTTRFSTRWKSDDSALDELNQVRDRLSEAEKDGLVRIGPDSCEITAAGRPFLRNICMAFDARLARSKPESQIFSRTV
ncbi:MAG: oxygen-independent coproporphyrinogen III oxidase [Bdellovibrionales bacterium]|nr:oxygen-independent coproporphyrinogen III oxidase [Bdellovibrionales bacterium]